MHLMETDPEDRQAPEQPGHTIMEASASESLTASRTDGSARPDQEIDFPEQVDPMLATVDAPRFGDEAGWAFEMKWDGVRTIAYLPMGA